MTDPVFRVDPGAFADPDRVVLAGPEGRHAAQVRRLRVGETLVVTDGLGRAARCRVRTVGRGELDLQVLSGWTEPEPYPRLVVVQALVKGEGGETAVQTLTEVGVDVIVPWAAQRSVARWAPDRAERALQRWRTAADEAAKQSRRVRWPQVRPPADTAEVCRLLAGAGLALVLHENADRPLAAVELAVEGLAQVALVIGPEGGIAVEELAAFTAQGAVPVRLGPTVMRSSTAGTAAAAVVLARTPRWT